MNGILRYWRGVYIFFTAYRFGLEDVAVKVTGKSWIAWLFRFLRCGYRFKTPYEVRTRLALEHLGPIFVKLGQVLSTRRDLLPSDMADELAKLQDKVPPFASKQAVSIVEQAFKKDLAQIFTSFERQPVASASIAQVHFASVLINGVNVDVAVKVLRPNMLKIIEKDLSLMYLTASWLEKFSADGRRLKPREVVQEFDKYLHDELDLYKEASNATQLKRNLASMKAVQIPDIYWDYCRTNVMTMERMNGISIGRLDELRQAGVDLTALAKTGVSAFFTQVFRDGFFHADMHPGNIHVSLAADNFGQFILLDFGIVGTLTEVDKEYLAQNFVAFFKRDYKRVAELHIESGWVPQNTRVDELESAVRACCEPFFDRPLKDISLGIVLMRLFQASRRFQVEIQPQLTLLQKTLLNVEGLGRQLDPELDLWTTALPFLEKWMHDELGPKKFWQQFKLEAPRYAKLIPQLPRLYHDYLLQPKVGELVQEVKLLRHEQQRKNNLLNNCLYLLLGVIFGFVLTLLLNSRIVIW